MTVKLSPRQAELMERVALKRYTVQRDFDMGWFQSASVRVIDNQGPEGVVGGSVDGSFRPVTVEALVAKGLARNQSTGPGAAVIKPTAAGLEWFRERRAKK